MLKRRSIELIDRLLSFRFKVTTVCMTLDEFLGRTERDDDQREELIDEKLVLSPGAKPSHAALVDRLRDGLTPLKQRNFALVNDFSCILGNRSMPVPDLAAVQKDRWNEAVNEEEWLEGSPELVIEVASPKQSRAAEKS